MYTEIQIRIKPEQAGVEETLRQIAARVAGVGAERIFRVDIVRKSIDARQKEVMFNLVAGLHIDRIGRKKRFSFRLTGMCPTEKRWSWSVQGLPVYSQLCV